ncbi:YfhO family protein [Streptomyces yerevanensis]|uniref:YfhO family protein n=1 Tax=Streptomyces yerevanensis TaxID=66378 RepID=UPI0005274AE1|nr:YfhO family protein [Streptomyces yerevanensis]
MKTRLAGPGLAAALAMAAFVISGTVRGTYPFGNRSRAVNDLGNQFVPFHAHLWDLLHGTSSGDLFFNWNSAFGVPYWADFVSFLGNPFSLLVAAFPRRQVDLGVYVGECLSIGLGAAVMTLWLRRLRPGSWWQAGLLGAAYALSGWTLNDGVFDPMWLWGLTAFPLMLLALDRCTRERGWLWAAPMVGLAWAGNFYTALMAAVGTIVVGAVLLATREWSRTGLLRFLGRIALTFALGTALAAPVIWPSYLAAAGAQPIPALPYSRPPALEYLLQLLPAQRGFGSLPRFFVGMLALLLVLAFPISRHIPVRTRVAWCAALAVVVASFCSLPTVRLWYGLSLPNGSPYRASFVLAGLLVSVAWLCLAHRPRPGPLLAAGAVTCVLAAVSVRNENGVSHLTWLVVLGSGGLTLALLLLLAGKRGARLIGAALAVLVLAESAASGVAVDQQRHKLAFYTPKPTWGARHDAVREAVTRVADWPAHRTDTGPPEIVNNDPQLLGSEGPAYYSSYVPKQTARLLRRLGYSWTMYGRHLIPQDSPVADAVFSVGARIRHTDAPGRVRVERFPAPPLVTVHPRAAPQLPPGSSSFAHQQAALGHQVYELPRISFTGAHGPEPRRASGPYRLTVAGAPYRITARCRPGSRLYVDGSWTDAMLAGSGGRSVRLWGERPEKAVATKPLGTVPADGRVTVTIATVFQDTELPRSPLACLDPAELRRAITDLRARGATHVTAGGHSVRATLPPGSKGTAVIATARTLGWRCAVDGGPMRAPQSRLGLIAVPLPDASEHQLHCSFRPPGLRAASAVSAGAVVLLLCVAAFLRRARRLGAVLRR